MMFQRFLHHFIRDIAATPRAVSDCPKMIAPIAFFQLWKFCLQQPRRATFQAFNQIRQSKFWRIFDVHMNVVFADYTRQNPNIFRVANLNQQISTARFYIAFQNVIAIFSTPNKMHGQPRNRVMTVSIFFHLPLFSHRF